MPTAVPPPGSSSAVSGSPAARGPARLTPDDWAGAALTALRERGPVAVAVEPLARALGATKGSFYWHFASREALLEAALARWEADETDGVIALVEQGAPRDRLVRLFTVVLASAGRHGGELSLYAAGADGAIRRAVARVSRRRIDYVQALLEEAGIAREEAGRRARLLFALVPGLDAVAATLPEELPTGAQVRRWAVSAIDMALSPT